MPRPKSVNDTQFALRLPASVLERADALIEHLSGAGFAVTRSDALRVALLRGLTSLEQEQHRESPELASKKSARRRK